MSGTRRPRPARIAFALAVRNLIGIRRLPSAFIPTLVFPVFLLAAFTGAFAAVTRLGFPTDSILDWYVPFAALQGAAFAGVGAGFQAARDLEGGFFDRLLLGPASPAAILAGGVLAAMVRATVTAVIVLGAGILLGARLQVPASEAPAALGLLFVGCWGAAIMAAGYGLGLAYRFKSQRAAALFPVGIFVALFLSTAQVPLEIMSGWLRAAARRNPVTYLLQLTRQGFLGEITWAATWPGLVAIATGGALLMAFAWRGLRRVIP